MAFTTPEQKRLKIFTIVFFIVLVVTLVIIYFGFWHRQSAPTVVVPLPTEGGYTVSLDNLKIDWQFLDSQTFKDLKFFGENPVTSGDKGRQNPFVPF